MKSLSLTILLAASAFADKPAVAPAYVPPAGGGGSAQDSYGSPVAAPSQDSYGSPVAAPSQDSYGSPVAAPVAAPSQDSYGSPKAPAVDSYGSPQAAAGGSYAAPAASAPVQQAPVGNQGYYYYYYPVRQNAPAAAAESDDGGLLGGLGGILGAVLGKKILLIALGITGFLVLAALGINFNLGRSFDSITARAMPYMTEDNLTILTDFVQTAVDTYQNMY